MSDTREKYFDENGLYDEDEEFLLIKPKDEYKEAYYNLCRESFLFIDKLDDEEYREQGWGLLFRMGLILFVIERKTNYFCGYVELKFIDSTMPEIGIELLKKYQGKGIGKQMIMLMLHKAQRIHPVDSYKVRIYADNINSQKLFERMGAKRIGEDDSDGVKMFKEAQKILEGEALASFTKTFEELYEERVPQVFLYELDKSNIL